METEEIKKLKKELGQKVQDEINAFIEKTDCYPEMRIDSLKGMGSSLPSGVIVDVQVIL